MFRHVGLVHATIADDIMPILLNIRKIITHQFKNHTTAASLAQEYDVLLDIIKNCCDKAHELGMLYVSGESAHVKTLSLSAATTVSTTATAGTTPPPLFGSDSESEGDGIRHDDSILPPTDSMLSCAAASVTENDDHSPVASRADLSKMMAYIHDVAVAMHPDSTIPLPPF